MDDISQLLDFTAAPDREDPARTSLIPIQALAWVTGTAPQQGQVTELSPRDVKIEFARPLKLGSLVEIELSSSRYGFSVAVHGLIHWQEQVTVGNWILGAFLNQTLPDNVVHHCWSDLRKELRYECRWDCELLTPRDRRHHSATLLNYSRSGAMIQSERSAARGEEVLIVDPADPERPVLVRGVVRWVTHAENRLALLGCELPDSQGGRLAAYLRTVGAYPDDGGC